MSNDVRIIDSLDKPNAVAPSNAAPLSIQQPAPRPRDDWRAILARGAVAGVLGTVGYAMFGHDIREWLMYGAGAPLATYGPYAALVLASAAAAKRYVFTDMIGGVPVRAWFNKVTAERIVDLAGSAGIEAARAPLPRGLQVYTPHNAVTHQPPAIEGEVVDAPALPEPIDPFTAALDSLPRLINLEHIIDNQPGGFSVPLGTDHTGASVWRDMRKDMLHVGIFGGTGAGKDNLFESWFVALTRQNTPEQVQFAVLDGKGHWTQPSIATRAHFWRAPAGGIGDEGQAEMQALLKAIQAEAQRRGRLVFGADCDTMERYMAKTGERMPYLVVYFSDVMGNLVNDVDKLLVDLVSKARALGIRVVVSLQTPTKQNTQWRANLSTVICGQLQGRSNDAPALGIGEKDILFPPSQLPAPKLRPGVFSVRSGHEQFLIQAPLVHRDYLARYMAELPTRRALRPGNAGATMPNLTHRPSAAVSMPVPDPLLTGLLSSSVRPSTPPTPAKARETAPESPRTDGRTDGLSQDRALLYLRVRVRQGDTREKARAWMEARGLAFQNSLYTEARRLEGK